MIGPIGFWVWQDGDRWAYRSHTFPTGAGSMDRVLGWAYTRTAAISKARRQIKELAPYRGTRLVDPPKDFRV